MELLLDLNKRYSYADYLTWMDDTRRELINGFIKLMSPAPGRSHQDTSGYLHGQFWHFLQKQPCKVYHAPFDVRLPKNGENSDQEIFTVVQPDLCIICDLSKLDEKGCLGAPDLIVEIVSNTSANRDVKEKFVLYEQSGVKEYWIVFPFEKVISVFLLENGKYVQRSMYAPGSDCPVALFNDTLIINTEELFSNL